MQSHYFSQLLTIVQESRIKYLAPKAERVAQYNEHLQSLMPDLVWTSPCNSWFKDGATGRIVAGYRESKYPLASDNKAGSVGETPSRYRRASS